MINRRSDIIPNEPTDFEKMGLMPETVELAKKHLPGNLQMQKLLAANPFREVPLPVGTHDGENAADLALTRDAGNIQVGVLFKKVLLAGLPDSLLDFDGWFAKFPLLERKIQEIVIKQPENLGAMPEAGTLVKYGLSPLTFCYAWQGIREALRQAEEEYGVDFERGVRLCPESPEAWGDYGLNTSRIGLQVELMCETGPDEAAVILKWFVEAARHKGHLFGEWEATPLPDGIILKKSNVIVSEMEQCWV